MKFYSLEYLVWLIFTLVFSVVVGVYLKRNPEWIIPTVFILHWFLLIDYLKDNYRDFSLPKFSFLSSESSSFAPYFQKTSLQPYN